MQSRYGLLVAVALVAIAAPGCPDLRTPPAGSGDGGPDADTDVDVDSDSDADGLDALDILFLVDNSNSMNEEQENLTANFPDLVRFLTNPPDDDGDGTPDYDPIPDMHVGVVSSDMGTGGHTVDTCSDADAGDDGILQHDPSPLVAGCAPKYPRFLVYDADRPDPTLAASFACIATLGTEGCGFEQQLAAVEKALTVHAQPGEPNDGFLRAEAILGIVIVTDEEDCSASDPAIFSDARELGPLNLRCFNHPEMVRPHEEFVDAILGLKPGRPERIVVAAIVGVPPDLVELTDEELRSPDVMPTIEFNSILSDPRMEERIDYSPEGGGNRLVPSCFVPGLGAAFPPRRIVRFVRDMDAAGNGGVVQSICQQDLARAMEAIARLVQARIES